MAGCGSPASGAGIWALAQHKSSPSSPTLAETYIVVNRPLGLYEFPPPSRCTLHGRLYSFLLNVLFMVKANLTLTYKEHCFFYARAWISTSFCIARHFSLRPPSNPACPHQHDLSRGIFVPVVVVFAFEVYMRYTEEKVIKQTL